MNLEETARVLAWAAAFDRRTIGEADVRAWNETVADLDVGDALRAVTRWYRDHTEWLMPAHLRAAYHEIRADRAREARWRAAEEKGLAPAQEALARPLASLPAEAREAVRSAARGRQGSPPAVFSPEELDTIARHRGELDEIDRHALAAAVAAERFPTAREVRAEDRRAS